MANRYKPKDSAGTGSWFKMSSISGADPVVIQFMDGLAQMQYL